MTSLAHCPVLAAPRGGRKGWGGEVGFLMAPLGSPGVPQGSGSSAESPRRAPSGTQVMAEFRDTSFSLPLALASARSPSGCSVAAAGWRDSAWSGGHVHGQASPPPQEEWVVVVVAVAGAPRVQAGGPLGTAHSWTSAFYLSILCH